MKKILLALDCSISSRCAAEYLVGFAAALENCQITLFSVLTGIPYTEAELTEGVPAPAEVHGDVDHQQEVAENRAFLEEVQNLLLTAGLPADRMRLLMRPERRGLAQDILDAAVDSGCDTIVVGRRGLSRVREILQGSVSNDLVHLAESVTVWVVA